MSDIKAGDLVMVVKAALCCGHARSVGLIYKVAALDGGWRTCSYCGSDHNGLSALDVDGSGCDVRRLIKIEPQTDDDAVPADQNVEIHA